MKKITKTVVLNKLAKAKVVKAKGSRKERATKGLEKSQIALRKAQERVAKLQVLVSKKQEEVEKANKPNKTSQSIEQLEKLLSVMEDKEAEALILDKENNVVGVMFEEGEQEVRKAQSEASE